MRLTGKRCPAEDTARPAGGDQPFALGVHRLYVLTIGPKDDSLELECARKLRGLDEEQVIFLQVRDGQRTHLNLEIAHERHGTDVVIAGATCTGALQQLGESRLEQHDLELLDPEGDAPGPLLDVNAERALTRLAERLDVDIVRAAEI
jgi:hypothetical protein